jgi:hypothetical protein
VSPSQLLFGNAIQLDKRLYLPVTALNVGERQLSDWADKQLREQSDLLEKARKRQIIVDEQNLAKRKRENDGPEWTRGEFPIGSLVLATYPDSGMGKRPPNKLMTPKRGPFEIIEKLRDEYKVRDLATGKSHKFSVHLLSPYYHNPNIHNPFEAAMVDKQLFEVAEILQHKGNPRHKSSLKFQVVW